MSDIILHRRLDRTDNTISSLLVILSSILNKYKKNITIIEIKNIRKITILCRANGILSKLGILLPYRLNYIIDYSLVCIYSYSSLYKCSTSLCYFIVPNVYVILLFPMFMLFYCSECLCYFIVPNVYVILLFPMFMLFYCSQCLCYFIVLNVYVILLF